MLILLQQKANSPGLKARWDVKVSGIVLLLVLWTLVEFL
jgi:hypothetical protein